MTEKYLRAFGESTTSSKMCCLLFAARYFFLFIYIRKKNVNDEIFE